MKLSVHQKIFFNDFGYLKVPKLLDDEFDLIESAFEECWSNLENYPKPYPSFQHPFLFRIADYHPILFSILTSHKIEEVVKSVLGKKFQYVGSRGNRFSGDTPWHRDSINEFSIAISAIMSNSSSSEYTSGRYQTRRRWQTPVRVPRPRQDKFEP